MLDFLAPVLQILTNSTLPTINIPATLTPIIGTASQTDNTSLVTSIGAIATSMFTLYQNHKDDNKQDKRTDSLADSQLSTVNSLQATDVSSKDDAHLSTLLVDALTKHPELQKILSDPANGKDGKSILDIAQKNKQGWDQAIQQYYDTKPTNPATYSKDPVLAKVATVQQVTQPTPVP